jgi:hypothetical protein
VSLKAKAGTAATVAGLLLLAGAYQAGKIPGTYTHRTTQGEMPKAKHVPLKDGRAYATVQICWQPRGILGSPHTVVGRLDRGDTNVSAPSCAEPYTRGGRVDPGDRVAVAWVINAGEKAQFIRWRITINNVQRMGGTETKQSMLNACIVGVPPC